MNRLLTLSSPLQRAVRSYVKVTFVNHRVLKAFAICPLTPAVAIAVVNGVMGAGLATIPIGVFFFLPFSYFLVFLFGSVTFLVLSALRLHSCQAYGIAGALTGSLVACTLPVLMLGRLFAFEACTAFHLLLLAAIGSVTGVVFWRVAFNKPAEGSGS